MKPKIIHVVNLKSFGGIQKLTIELTTLLNSQGAVVNHLFTTQDIDFMQGSLPNNVKIININRVRFVPRILKIHKVFKNYDIVHFHGPFTLFQLVAMFSNKKIVYTEHGTLQKANIRSTFKHFIQKRTFGKFFLEYFVNRVIFISQWIQADVAINNKNQCVIYNGLNYQKPNVEKNDGFVLTIAARLISKKRVDLAIDLMRNLKEYPDIKLQVIGDGPEMENLKKYASQLLGNTIIFLGYRRDALNIIASSDVYLMTTDMEPFGLVVLEAMMSETIVLALADSGGPAEILKKDGFNKLIFDDLENLSKAVLFWKNNTDKKRDMELNLRNLYQTKYTMFNMAKSYQELYLNLINF